uniref:O-methyltransferase n=1 Tax=Ascaris lumbricoides TaxID=6252 RepID=A0A0M3I3U2_ASCLU
MEQIQPPHHIRDKGPQCKYVVSVKLDPLQAQLNARTMSERGGGMIGAPEVHQLGQNLIRLIGAKRVLDIGTFTGASALAWASAVPSDGEVFTMDITPGPYYRVGRPLISSRPDIAAKIKFFVGPALRQLDYLIASGQAGTWDFAFIDADKHNYPNYYEKCVQLLRPGGVILIDNALWHGNVAYKYKDQTAMIIDATNQRAASDPRVDNFLLNLGDGTHVIFKRRY